MRVLVKVQGAANGQALFDVLHGHAVCWKEGNGAWQLVTFDFDSVEAAAAHLRNLFPHMRLHVSRAWSVTA